MNLGATFGYPTNSYPRKIGLTTHGNSWNGGNLKGMVFNDCDDRSRRPNMQQQDVENILGRLNPGDSYDSEHIWVVQNRWNWKLEKKKTPWLW